MATCSRGVDGAFHELVEYEGIDHPQHCEQPQQEHGQDRGKRAIVPSSAAHPVAVIPVRKIRTYPRGGSMCPELVRTRGFGHLTSGYVSSNCRPIFMLFSKGKDCSWELNPQNGCDEQQYRGRKMEHISSDAQAPAHLGGLPLSAGRPPRYRRRGRRPRCRISPWRPPPR